VQFALKSAASEMSKGLPLTLTPCDIAYYSTFIAIGFSATTIPLKPKIKGRWPPA